MTGRWLVDNWKTEAIYQPITHYQTMRYTPAGRYGGFFALRLAYTILDTIDATSNHSIILPK